jgi:tyrosine-protein kinase Etk/Wzc
MEKRNLQIEDDNILNQILFRFVPYWPLFICLLIVSGVGGFIYLRYATPIYEVSATMLIKDEKKGLDDSRIMQSLNIFSPNNIVENEMEVLQSSIFMPPFSPKVE